MEKLNGMNEQRKLEHSTDKEGRNGCKLKKNVNKFVLKCEICIEFNTSNFSDK